MANKRISELASASALSGAEVLPIVQAGATKKVTTQAIADLAAGASSSIQIVVGGGIIQTNPLSINYYTRAFMPNNGGTAEILTYPQYYFQGYGSTMTSLSFPGLKFCDFNIYSNNYLQTISFPNVTSIRNTGMGGSITVANNPALTTLSMPALTYVDNNCYLYYYNNLFTSATVDHILEKFVGTGATGGTLGLGGTNQAPTSAGLASVATLVSRGWTVSHN